MRSFKGHSRRDTQNTETKIQRKEGVTMDKQERDKWQADSEHSFERAKKRAGLSKKKAAKLMELAKERGKGFEECRWSKDRAYLVGRTNNIAVALAYNGFCFIFDRETCRCITMYPLPKSFGKKKTFYNTRSKRTECEYELQYA